MIDSMIDKKGDIYFVLVMIWINRKCILFGFYYVIGKYGLVVISIGKIIVKMEFFCV